MTSGHAGHNPVPFASGNGADGTGSYLADGETVTEGDAESVDATANLAADVLDAIRTYERACWDRMSKESTRIWGHSGGYVGELSPSEDGRCAVIAAVLKKATAR